MNAPSKKNEYYLGLGSNIEPAKNLRLAVIRLRNTTKVIGISQVYKSHAEDKNEPDFLNTVLKIHSNLDPIELKTDILLAIEDELGRKRTGDKNAPRTIDLDILLHNEMILDPNIWSRVYIAVPLAEFIPDLRKTDSGQMLGNIATRLRKQNYIEEVKLFHWDSY